MTESPPNSSLLTRESCTIGVGSDQCPAELEVCEEVERFRGCALPQRSDLALEVGVIFSRRPMPATVGACSRLVRLGRATVMYEVIGDLLDLVLQLELHDPPVRESASSRPMPRSPTTPPGGSR